MKIFTLIFIALVLLAANDNLFAQRQTAWEQVSPKVKNRNAFKRMEWFYRQRALPEDTIPYYKFYEEKQKEVSKYQWQNLKANKGPVEQSTTNGVFNWVAIGPTGINSGWPPLWGVISGRIRAIAVHPSDPNIVYIGAASGGIWKTTNGGTTWNDIGLNLENLTFGAITIDPNNTNTIYAGTGESMLYFNLNTYTGNGLYKSTNGGADWVNISNGIGTKTQFSSIKVSPFNSNVVYATMGRGYWLYQSPGNGGVWRSSDAGLSWTKTLPANDAFDIIPHPTIANRVYAAVGGSVSTSGFYYSTNDGVNWTKSSTGLPLASTIGRIQIALAPSAPNIIYAAIYRSDLDSTQIFKTNNNGTSWNRISIGVKLGGTYDGSNWSDQGWYDLCIAVDPGDSNKVFLGNIEMHKTTNGSTFSPVRSTSGPYGGISAWDSPMHVDYHQIVFAPSNRSVIYVGCDGGIFKSTNGGTTWSHRNNGISTIQLYRVAGSLMAKGNIIGGAQDNGIFLTRNEGSTNWDLIGTGDGMEVFFHPTNPLIAYGSTQYGSLNRTVDGGASYQSISPSFSEPVAWTAPFFMHPTDPNTLYFATTRPYRSTNGGTTWTPLTSTQVTTSPINTMAQSPVTPANMALVGGEYDTSPEVYVSTDGGFKWSQVTTNIPGPVRYISRVVFHPTEPNTLYVVRSGFGSGKIYKSTDLGATWTNISGDLPDIPHNDLFIDPESTSLMFTANDLGVYLSTNGGNSWNREGNNMPFVPAVDFDYQKIGFQRMLRVATHGRSVYEANITSIVPVELTSFSAALKNGKVTLQWSTATEKNNRGFEIQRSLSSLSQNIDGGSSPGEANWKKIGFMDGKGTTAERQNYSFEDVPVSGSYCYRLKQIDLDGTFKYSGIVEINYHNIKNFELVQNYPNPFNPSTKINYFLPEAGTVKLSVFNVLGEKITDLVNELKDAGEYETLWNAENLAAGIYFYNLEIISNGKIVYNNSKKMVLNK